MKGLSFMEGAETRLMSPNNNLIHERPAPYGDDIVRASGKPLEFRYKQLEGNNTVLNSTALPRKARIGSFAQGITSV